MNTLKFSISVKAINSYIYSGHFFLILATGEIAFTPLSNVMRSLVNKYPKFENLLRVAFQRNDYLANTQSKMLFGIGELKYEFRDLWEEASKKIKFNIDFNIDHYKIISKVPSMPVLDLKLYAMKMFVGAKKGLYEIDLKPEDNRYHLNPSKAKKRFDAKVIGLSAKSGQVMISGGSNGLFHGTFLNEKNKLEVVEQPLAKKSLRTSWSAFDTINYAKNLKKQMKLLPQK